MVTWSGRTSSESSKMINCIKQLAKDNNIKLSRFGLRFRINECVEKLLENPNIQNNKEIKNNLLCHSVKAGNLKSAKMLLNNGADPNCGLEFEVGFSSKNKKIIHSTPLIYAAGYKNHKMTELLLNNGADVNARDYKGQTALHKIARKYDPRIFSLLVKNGADVNAKDINEKTPLALATNDAGSTGMVIKLLNNGANPHCVDKKDITTGTDRNLIRILIEEAKMKTQQPIKIEEKIKDNNKVLSNNKINKFSENSIFKNLTELSVVKQDQEIKNGQKTTQKPIIQSAVKQNNSKSI